MVRAYLHSSLPYYLNTAIVFLFMYITEVYQRPFLIFVIIYALIPLIDLILPDDNLNPTPEEEKLLSSQLKWKIPIYLFVVVEWVCLFWSFNYITRTDPSFIQFFVLILAVGHVSAIGFLFSHELFHKRDLLGQVVGTLDMLKSLYMHFYSEHLLGHHKYVSTPQDPATARYNQSLYGFIMQTVTGSFVNTWNREKKQAAKRKQSPYGFGNRMVQWLTLETGFTVAIGVFFGTRVLGFFIGQAICSVSILETINYIRHYGLLRKKLPNGEYEPVTTKHSWNAPQTLQNMILLKLQRHSDHHANAYKPYQILKSCLDSPNLPCGYAVCLLASFVPPFWFSIVNPLAEATNQSGKPSDRQMNESTKALRLWLLLQVSSMVALSFILN
jgi:alkane 1-monooxygenase